MGLDTGGKAELAGDGLRKNPVEMEDVEAFLRNGGDFNVAFGWSSIFVELFHLGFADWAGCGAGDVLAGELCRL